MVERSLGEAGLGVFVYLLSILMFAGFISEYGISRYLEREIAIIEGDKAQTQAIEKALYAVLVTSIVCAVLFLITAVFDTAHTRVEEKVAAYFIIGITIPLRNLNRIRIRLWHP
ncbi:MAG: oligosaccharide flippase family protein [Proteobacteria bacterium]|nr:oligosaccharide flippase family protein [Pseudomonadota bacterium]